MTLEDFSSGFDTLLNSYAVEAGFGEDSSKGSLTFTEYEKSLFLTKFQDEFTVSLYRGDLLGTGFEGTEELRRYLAPLVKDAELSPVEEDGKLTLSHKGMESFSLFFRLPTDLRFITYEAVGLDADSRPCAGIARLDVVPARQDEYNRLRKNPFRGANNRRALRFDLSDGYVEIVSRYRVTKYYLRYLRKAAPIILIDLGHENTIEGVSHASPCELHEALHQRILEGAVQLALQSRGYTRQKDSN